MIALCKCERDPPRLPEDFPLVFWLRRLIEIARLFRLHIVYVLAPRRTVRGRVYSEVKDFFIFLQGLASVVLNAFMAL